MSDNQANQQPDSSGMTFDAQPVVKDTSAGSGMTFDSSPTHLDTTVLNGKPLGDDPGARFSVPGTGTISAIKPPAHIGEAIEQWTNNVMNDLKYGTDLTGVGSVLKAMGAHGVYAGNSEAVGDFMASLPLGAIKMLRGASKVSQSGKRWEGTKDVASGALQAATIPSAFVAPEAGELATEGAANVASKVTAPIREAAAQPELQAGIRQVAGKVAQEAEVVAPKTPSMYKTVEEVGDNVLAKSKGLYKTLDEATGGKVQRFRDRLDNIRQQMNSLTGTEEDTAKEASLIKAQKETEDAMQDAFAEAKAKGVDPETLNKADQTFKQGQALYDLDTAVQRATSGKPAGVGTKGIPETVDPKKLAPRVTALWKSGRLQQALGEENATDLMNYVGDAAKHQQTAVKLKMLLKAAGVTSLVTGGGGVLGHIVSHAATGH